MSLWKSDVYDKEDLSYLLAVLPISLPYNCVHWLFVISCPKVHQIKILFQHVRCTVSSGYFTVHWPTSDCVHKEAAPDTEADKPAEDATATTPPPDFPEDPTPYDDEDDDRYDDEDHYDDEDDYQDEVRSWYLSLLAFVEEAKINV